MAYCCTVPSGWLLTRRNGKVTVQGNCNFGYPGGLGTTTFIEFAKNTYGQVFTEDQARDLRKLWIESFQEMGEHLSGTVDPFNKDDYGKDLYIGSTIHGRVRAAADFCASLNYQFQGIAADGAKNALWDLFLNRYKVVNFVHDEAISELELNNNLQAHCRKIDKLMVDAMVRWIPDVLIEVEGALMRRWYKGAEPILDRNGNIIVWTPEIHDRVEEAKENGDAFILDKNKNMVDADWTEFLSEEELQYLAN
jgi:hypothetical protein